MTSVQGAVGGTMVVATLRSKSYGSISILFCPFMPLSQFEFPTLYALNLVS